MTKATYEYIIDKVCQRLSGWAARKLSMASRITLIQSVMASIPRYAMQMSILPSTLCEE